MTKIIFVAILSLFVVLGYAATSEPEGDYRQTPFGRKHKDCILEVPSGSHIETRIIDGVEHAHVLHPNGTTKLHPQCPHGDSPAKRTTYVWNGWPEHYWYGVDYSYFTSPTLTSAVTSFEATWNVPNYPANRAANTASPWPWQPTLSWWTGIQPDYASSQRINTVLQPVLEFNGLIANAYDLSSWNCCPAGYTVHSTAIAINPGQTAIGTMDLTAPYTYNIVSQVSGGASTSLSAAFPSTTPNFAWAEVKNEGYYVTNCNQLPSNAVTFTITKFVTSAGTLNVNTLPWQQGYQCDSTTCPSAALSSSCVGFTSQSNNLVSIGF